MKLVPRWQEFPPRFRFLLVIFGTLGFIALIVVAAGLRAWFHAVETLALVWIVLVFLRGLLTPAPGGSLRGPSFPVTFYYGVGGLVLFLSGWALVGLVDVALHGVLPEYVLEGNVFVAGSIAFGAMLLRNGRIRSRDISQHSRP